MAEVKSLNKVVLVGTVQPRDPEVKQVGETKLAKFTMVTKDGYFDKSKKWIENTEWHDITAWGWLAEKVENKLSKGTMVIVEGSIKTSKWEAEDGSSRSSKGVNARTIIVLDGKRKDGDDGIGDDLKDMDDTTSDVDGDGAGFDDPF